MMSRWIIRLIGRGGCEGDEWAVREGMSCFRCMGCWVGCIFPSWSMSIGRSALLHLHLHRKGVWGA